MHYKGPALVLAGPGSGKTTVLVERVKNLILERNVSPDKILVVTFARSAAAQMQERFLRSTEGRFASVTFSTIHSVCYSIINSEDSFVNYSLLPENEKTDFLRKTIQEYFLRFPEQTKVPGLLKDVLMELSAFKKGKNMRGGYKTKYCDRRLFEYCKNKLEEFKVFNKYFDFDDMAEMTDRLLSSNTELYGRSVRFEYVLVDEFQDTGADQFSFLRKLCIEDNFYAVGDEDQSIYGFRGACPEIMLKFREYFSDCRIYDLPENFRSHPEIVNKSATLIKNNKKRYDKRSLAVLKSENDESVKILSAKDENEELDLLVSEIRKIKNGSENIAILVRTRGILDFIAGKLMQSDINFFVKDRVSNIFEVPVIKTVMSFFRVSLGVGSTDDYIRIFKTTDLKAYESFLGSHSFSWESIRSYYRGDEKVKDFEYKVKSIRKFSPEIALEFIRNVLGLDRKISVYEKSKLCEFEVVIKRCENIRSVLDREKTYSEMVECKNTDKNLVLSTIHSAKGLEFDRVFIPFMNEGNIPLSKAVSENDTEEERRIFYVALTRAKKEVTMIFHESLRNKRAVPSRFLKEMGFLP